MYFQWVDVFSSKDYAWVTVLIVAYRFYKPKGPQEAYVAKFSSSSFFFSTIFLS